MASPMISAALDDLVMLERNPANRPAVECLRNHLENARYALRETSS